MPIMAPPVLQFQSIGSFDREMEQREAAERLKRAAPKKAKGQNPAKKLKKMAEVEAKELRRFEERAAEEVLLKEVGETNWIGKVNGQIQALEISNTTNKLQNTAAQIL